MQLIGYDLVEFKALKFINSKDELEHNSLFKFDKHLIKLAQKNGFEFSVICQNLKEAIISNAVGAKFIICDKIMANEFSNLAEYYMFDSKIACVIDDEAELEELAKLKVDTAIFKQGIVNGNF